MNRMNIEAAGDVEKANRLAECNKDRQSWTLAEWSDYFRPPDLVHVMSTEEIAAAVLWLTEKGYPIPTDCPKRYEPPWTKQGGCPAFKPVCLTHPICQMARGMCDELNTMAKCPTCQQMFDTTRLRDALSQREFEISGMCQKCQDSVFGK